MSDSLLVLPALYPIKVIGDNTVKFADAIKLVLTNYHISDVPIVFEMIESKNSNYISISTEVYIKNHAELHEMYRLLNANPATKMVL